MTNQYDAILIQSFGGPEGPEDVMPFLRNVTNKRNVPDERLLEVAEQYEMFDGISPINQHCRELVTLVEHTLKDHNIDLPVYWGNRNWTPFIEDTAKQMVADGVKNALVFTTSAFSSYSGCRQYREDLEKAELATENRVSLRKLRLYYNHPLFIETWVDNIKSCLESAPNARLIFTAHSIPESMAAACDYVAQLNEAGKIISSELGVTEFDLVYQSRSGPPHIPWLVPDINDFIEGLDSASNQKLVVCPLGFTSDHMEVMFDLDTQATQTAETLGMELVRVPTVGNDPRIGEMVIELIREQLEGVEPRALGDLGPWPDQCPEGHCIPASRP